jgi:hypothetical protein
VRVKYFTARIVDRPDDPFQSQRQDVYLRALGTRTGIELYIGHFQTHKKRVRLARPRNDGSLYDEALITEEKSTDVALGAHLVRDALRGQVQCAVIMSNDSDLQVPIDMARDTRVRVVVVNPHYHNGQPHHLEGDERRNLSIRHLRSSQLPSVLYAADGSPIARPKDWA